MEIWKFTAGPWVGVFGSVIALSLNFKQNGFFESCFFDNDFL